ncbi:IclR family transcriptional regulator [Salirhabdus salicampi]|uniref:IclR family transcriptional regulator n=1 Tax=Salirhabdus salicampi TaxID=476102 RepID=UPI0020C2142D|nr:IclR family transcriptional regulator [Salirhabdus salicampi]MCP8615256.1 IclR family transcriptional regulator [Salirhabdus salicampi]
MSSSINKTGVISKAFKIINVFIDEKPEWGVRELANYLNVPTSTLHRFLLQLLDIGVLEFKESTNKYVIGSELIRISSAVSSRIDIKKIARPLLKELVDKHKETVCLVLYHKQSKKVSFVEKVNGPDPLQYMINLGELHAVPYGSTGKSIMAYLTDEECNSILEAEGFSDAEIEKFKEELRDIREKGYASSVGERFKSSKGVSAPIFNASGNPIGSLAYTVPITRMTHDVIEIASDLKSSALQISRLLGYTGTIY